MAKTPGRKRGYRHPEEVREKIQATALINRLMSHITAEQPTMDASQVNAAKALLSKVLPDLKAVEVSNKDGEAFKTEETGGASAKVLGLIETLEERSGTSSSTASE